MLSSTLPGPGRATTQLNLSSDEFLPPCSPQFWSSGSAARMQPRLGLAGIPRSPGREQAGRLPEQARQHLGEPIHHAPLPLPQNST